MTDYARLRALAEAATPGPWYVDDAGDIAAPKRESAPDWASREWVVAGDGQCAVGDSDAAYIAAADPPTMLALLDRLEAADQRAAEYAAVVEKVRDIIHGPSGLSINEEKVWLAVHAAPADALRELKADVWDEGEGAGAKNQANWDGWQDAKPPITNPYREDQS